MKISLRDALLKDLEWLEPFYESIMRPYVELTHQWNSHQFREHFEPQFIKIIQAERIDIGMLKVEEKDNYFYLGDIQIAPDYQGKGMGTSLIKAVIQSATRVNKPVRLRVLKGNPAKNLYLRLGFKEIEILDNCYLMERETSPTS